MIYDFLGVSEEKYLHQLYLEEQFGVNAHVETDKSTKKKNSQAGAAIGYTYDENEAVPTFSKTIQSIESNSIARFDDVNELLLDDLEYLLESRRLGDFERGLLFLTELALERLRLE